MDSFMDSKKANTWSHALMQELLTEDPKGFQNFLRMDKTDFQELLAKVTPHIQRQDTTNHERPFDSQHNVACDLRQDDGLTS
jgi:hypothetical protein